jgi:hypothetical protein
LVKPITKIYSQRFYRNLFCIFLSFISFSMHFRILNEFLEFIIKNWNPGKEKWVNSARPKSGPQPHYAGLAQRGKGCRPTHAGGAMWYEYSNNLLSLEPGCHIGAARVPWSLSLDPVVFLAIQWVSGHWRSMGTTVGSSSSSLPSSSPHDLVTTKIWPSMTFWNIIEGASLNIFYDIS